MYVQTAIVRHLMGMLIVTTAFALSGCAALQPVDANGPRANAPAYPISLAAPAARLEEASVAWPTMSEHYGLAAKTSANLNPDTGTLQGLPANTGPIALPKVG